MGYKIEGDIVKVYGHFDQELNVGDRIAMVASSNGYSYMLVAEIAYIGTKTKFVNSWNNRSWVKKDVGLEPVVKVKYSSQRRKWDWKTRSYIELGEFTRVSRVYNWHTAITLPPEIKQ